MINEVVQYLKGERDKGLFECQYVSFDSDSLALSETTYSPTVVIKENGDVYVGNVLLKEKMTTRQAIRFVNALFIKDNC